MRPAGPEVQPPAARPPADPRQRTPGWGGSPAGASRSHSFATTRETSGSPIARQTLWALSRAHGTRSPCTGCPQARTPCSSFSMTRGPVVHCRARQLRRQADPRPRARASARSAHGGVPTPRVWPEPAWESRIGERDLPLRRQRRLAGVDLDRGSAERDRGPGVRRATRCGSVGQGRARPRSPWSTGGPHRRPLTKCGSSLPSAGVAPRWPRSGSASPRPGPRGRKWSAGPWYGPALPQRRPALTT